MLYSYKEAMSLFCTPYYLNKALKEKKIFKIERGIYSDGINNFDIYELLLKKYPNSFLVKDSALFYINFISEKPNIVHLGTPRNALRIKDPRVCQHYYSKLDEEFINDRIPHLLSYANIITHKTANLNYIRIFKISALLYDCIRNKSVIPKNKYKLIIKHFRTCNMLHDFDRNIFLSNLKNEQIKFYDYSLFKALEETVYKNSANTYYEE